MYPVLSLAFFVFSPKIYEHKQVALPISMYKHLSCAAFEIKLTTGSGNAGTCEKLHDLSPIRLRQKAGVCTGALTVRGCTLWCISVLVYVYGLEAMQCIFLSWLVGCIS